MLNRPLYLALGFVSLVLGMIGVFLPVLPTTPFILLAAFCFSKSSERWHQWLLENPVFGPMIRDWNHSGVIRRPAKILASVMMTVSFSSLTVLTPVPLWVKLILNGIGLCVLGFIWSRPSDRVDSTRKQDGEVLKH